MRVSALREIVTAATGASGHFHRGRARVTPLVRVRVRVRVKG